MTHREHRNGFEVEDQSEVTASRGFQEILELLVEHGFDGMAQAMQTLLNEAMRLERSQVLGAQPYQRTSQRRGYANGFKPKSVETRLGRLDLAVPQTRGIPFYPTALERGTRSERALKLAIAEMYLQGVSTRKVTAVMEQLCGREVTSMQVSRAVAALDDELAKWRERPLGETPYVQLDARYEKVRINGTVVCCSLLLAQGVTPDGHRTILGVSVSLSEAEVHWREFLARLQERGLHGVQLVTSDDHAGLRAALTSRLPGVKWQRCQFHLAKNLLDHLPPNVPQEEASADLRAVFNAPNRAEADRRLGLMVAKYAPMSKKLAAWLEANVPEGLTVFDFPVAHRRRLRTNNGLERLNREIKRRTRVASIFPNEASLLRLATAVLMEVDDEWQTEKRYLPKTNP
jgi:transposase-like protein